MTNKLIYDTDILYNQNMSEKSQIIFRDLYKELFNGYNIKTIHDCSIGAGGTSIPLAKLGYIVSGSDLNENLLNSAKNNFSKSGFSPNLFLSDLREIGNTLADNVDCIISTGNSLPHVDLEGFKRFLHSASTRLNDNGLLFFDIRNWDVLASEKIIFQAIDPHVMTAEEHRSMHLLFNWHDNGSVTFSFVTCVDRNGKHISHDVITCPPYYPLLKSDIETAFAENGYKLLRYIDLDDIWINKSLIKDKSGDFEKDFDNIQWYGVLAQKVV